MCAEGPESVDDSRISIGNRFHDPIENRFDGAALDTANVLATGTAAESLHERCDALTTAFTTIELAGMMRRVQELTTEYITGRIRLDEQRV